MSALFEEIREIVKKANPFNIIHSPTYLYFSIQPTQEQVVFQQVLKKKNLSIVAVYNYRDVIIGYLVEFKDAVLNISKSADGVGIFFSDKEKYPKPKLIFSDAKLRVLAFGADDYYLSVKWKSNMSTEEL